MLGISFIPQYSAARVLLEQWIYKGEIHGAHWLRF
jgi:hypothetical protein